jgi:glycosyltransferase involved in cell wall biosynthesis
VLYSRISALVELVGPAGISFDPYDVPAMAGVLDRLASDPDVRRDLIHRGMRRVREFSWEQTAEQIWAVLDGS